MKRHLSQAGPKRFVFGLWQVIWPFIFAAGVIYLLFWNLRVRRQTSLMLRATAVQVVRNYNQGVQRGVLWNGNNKEEIIKDVLQGRPSTAGIYNGEKFGLEISDPLPPIMLPELYTMITFDGKGNMVVTN